MEWMYMLSKPRNGWVNVEIEEFVGRASYIREVPDDCLDAFILGLKNRLPVVIEFDAEGWEFTLVSKYYSTFIIVEAEDTKLIEINKTNMELAREIINDIESNIELWSKWSSFVEEDCDKKKDELLAKLNELKGVLEEL